MLRLSSEDRKDRMGGIEAVVVLDPLVVGGLYDTGGFLETEARFSSEAVLCKDLMSKSSRWPDEPSLVVVAPAGIPSEGDSLSCADGGFAEMGERFCRTVTIVSEDLEADLTPVAAETALSSDVARFTWAGGLAAGNGAGASWNVVARDLTGSACSSGGAGETARWSETCCFLISGSEAIDGEK